MVAAAGPLFAFEQFDVLVSTLWPALESRLPHLSLASLMAGAALATLLVLIWAAYRRRAAQLQPLFAMLLALNVGLQVVAWIYDLYSQSSEQPFTIAQAGVLLVALSWEVTMSGKAITNRGGAWFPRHSRVLLYFGYIMLTAAAILFFSSVRVQSTGTSVEPIFEGEVWPQSGLLLLGPPLLFTVFVLRLVRWIGGRETESHTSGSV